jgi:hypothetical protein
MMKLARMSSLLSCTVALIVMFGAFAHSHAQSGCDTGGTGCGSAASAPEIDPSLGTGAIALLGGAIFLVRSRRKL